MQQPQILSYGVEGRLADQLRELAQTRRLWLREVRHLAACQNALRGGHPTVLVLRLGRDLEQELTLLAQVHDLFPTTAVLVAGDAEQPSLAGLAWDLGATYVLFPPVPIEVLSTVVLQLIAG